MASKLYLHVRPNEYVEPLPVILCVSVLTKVWPLHIWQFCDLADKHTHLNIYIQIVVNEKRN